MNRISKDEYYLNIAGEVSKRSTCIRRNYGAIIVKEDQIISAGYGGAPRKTKNCITIGLCARNEIGARKGENYELCRAVHAEQNAMLHASRLEMMGATIGTVSTKMATPSRNIPRII